MMRWRFGIRGRLGGLAIGLLLATSWGTAASGACQDLEPEDLEFLHSLEKRIVRERLGASQVMDLAELVEELPRSWQAWRVVFLWRRAQTAWEVEPGEGGGPLDVGLDQIAERLEACGAGRVEALRLVAENHELHGRFGQALETLDALLAKWPGDIEGWIDKVRVLKSSGDRSGALEVARDVIRRVRAGGLSAAEANWAIGRLLMLTANLESRPDARHRAIVAASRGLALAEKALRDGDDPRHARSLADLTALHLLGRLDGDAEKVLEQYRLALEEASYLPGLHVGLARAYLYRQEIHQAEEQVKRALAKRPDDPTALAMQASFRLRDHRYSDARKLLAHALRINPRHGEALATLAACQYLRGEQAWQDTINRALGVDPHDGYAYRILADAVALHYRFAEAVPFYRKALELDPQEHAARIGLGQCLAHGGDLEAAYQSLDRARQLDDFRYPWRANMLKLLDYYRHIPLISRGHFRFRIQVDDAKVLLDDLSLQLEAAYRDLAAEYGEDLPGEVTIEVLRTHPDFSVRTIGFSGLGALGVCFGDVVALLSPASELRGSFVWARTARHELAHVFSLDRSRLRVPRWLTEGLSVFEESHGRACWDRDMDFALFNAYHNEELIPLAEMNAAFRGPRILFGYYQAGLFCRYIDETYGFDRIVRMLELYGEDRETAEVVDQVFGRSLGEMDSAFREWVYEQYLEGIRLYPIWGARKRDEFRATVAAHPDDPDLREKLAWAYLQGGHAVDMDVQLARLEELAPESGGLWLLMGHRALLHHDRQEALKAFEKGIERGADDMFVRLEMATLYAESGEMESMSAALEAAKLDFERYVGPGNAYLRLARYAEVTGDEQRAIEEYQALAAIDQTSVLARQRLIEYHQKRSEYGEVAARLRELIEIDPFQRQPHVALAKAYRELGRHADAIRELRIALAVDPRMEPDYNPPPSDEEADRLAAEERRQQAELQLQLARLYEDLGDRTAARDAVDKASELDPDNEEARAVRARLDRGDG